MKSKNLLICAVIMAFLWGCEKDDPATSLSFEIIKEDHLSYGEVEIIPEQTLVFKTESDFHDFIPEIERLNPGRASKLLELDMDFAKNDLVLVIGEYYYYCCSRIIVSGVYKENGRIVVKYDETGPGGFTALSQAYILLMVPKEESK